MIPSMARDYAKPRRQPDKQTYTLFHAPSFAFGILFGMALVFIGAYGPEWLARDKVQPPEVKPPEEVKPQVKFEFPKLLEENQVEVDPRTYAPPGSLDQPVEPENPREYLIQLGSFRSVADAESVRALLLLQDLPVSMTPVELPDGTWYRVIVGPYSDKVDAEALVENLREQRLNVILQERTTP